MEQKSDPPKSPIVRARSESPISKCPICLSLIDNPAFTDACIHKFCFTCLCEWAKLKAVCPVCKQDFLSIAYNVQSYEKFDELPVKNLTIQDTSSIFQDNQTGIQLNALFSRQRAYGNHGHPQDARFRYRTTMTSDYRDVLRRLEEQRLTVELCNPSVRMTFNHRPFVFSSNARKAVYRPGLRVQHLQTPTEQVFSLINPQFFNDNPACKIRLSPWLQRELDVMAELRDVPVIGDTMLLINLIFSLLNTLKITSQNFYNKLYPYLRRHTLHFLQELYCFACSAPYTMAQYDSCVVYGDGTSGAIWSVWHRDKTHSNSNISTAIHDPTREEDIIEIPSETGFISFVMKKRRRNTNESSATPIQGTSGMRATQNGQVDVVQESSDSGSDVEVVGQEPPWDARQPIVIDDSEEETTDREEGVESRVDRELTYEYPVSKTPREHEVDRTSVDPPSPASVSLVNEHRFHLSDEAGMLKSLHSSQKRKRENKKRKKENKSADDERDISDITEEENTGHRFNTKHNQSPSNDWQDHCRRDGQNHTKEPKRPDRKSQISHSRVERSSYSTLVTKYIEISYKEESASTERQGQYKHQSKERSKSYRSSHSKETSRGHQKSHSKELSRGHQKSHSKKTSREHRRSHSREPSREHRRSHSRELSRGHRRSHSREPSRKHRRSRSKERPRTSRKSLSKDLLRLHQQICSTEHDDSHSRRLPTEHHEMYSGDRKPPSCSFEKLFRCIKEQQPLECTKRKRRNSGLTYHCDSSETDEYRRSSNKADICERGCTSSSFASQSPSSSIQTFSNVSRSIASCKPSLVGEDLVGDRKLNLRTDVDSFTRSFNETESDSFPRNVSREDSKTVTENINLNDSSFDRKTCFWSDAEEEISEDAASSGSKTLKSQIGCMLFTGSCGASSVLEPLSAGEELIVIESSECSSSNRRWCLSKDYDINEASYSHKNKQRKHWSPSSMSSKNSYKECENELQYVSRGSKSTKEDSSSLESQQSKKQRSRRQMSSKKNKRKRQDVDTDSQGQNRTTNRIEKHRDVGLARERFDEDAAQHSVNDDTDDNDDDGIFRNKSLNVAGEVTFKKHYTGHKNLHLKTTKR